MSNPVSIDKTTVMNILAGFIIVFYVLFMFLNPEKVVPAGLVALANMAIGYLFTTAGISYAQKLQKTQ